jgi:hypothetical protein
MRPLLNSLGRGEKEKGQFWPGLDKRAHIGEDAIEYALCLSLQTSVIK